MVFLDVGNLINVTNFNVLTLGASCVTIFLTVYFSNKSMKHKMRMENEQKLGKKADLTYVKEKNLEHEKDIIEIKASIKTMGDGNSKQHKDMFNKIEEIGKGVARVEGYLSAKKEEK